MTEVEKLKLQLDQALVELHRYDSLLTILQQTINSNYIDIAKTIERIENAGLAIPDRRCETRTRDIKEE